MSPLPDYNGVGRPFRVVHAEERSIGYRTIFYCYSFRDVIGRIYDYGCFAPGDYIAVSDITNGERRLYRVASQSECEVIEAVKVPSYEMEGHAVVGFENDYDAYDVWGWAGGIS